MCDRRAGVVSGMNGWLTLGACLRPSVGGVSTSPEFVDWMVVDLRRSEVRGVEADIVRLERHDSFAP